MKRNPIIALIAAAALLTGCSSGNAAEGEVIGAESAAHGAADSGGYGSPSGYSAPKDSAKPEEASTPAELPDAGTAAEPRKDSEAEAPAESAASSTPHAGTDIAETAAASASVTETSAATAAASTKPHAADEASAPGDYSPTDIGGIGTDGEKADDITPMVEFAEADIAADGLVECPEPIDPLEPIEPIEPIETIIPDDPWIDPQAGLLTGGEWNDNDNWDFWNSLYTSNNYGVDWSGYLESWRTGAQQRAAVTVRDSSGAAVAGAKVEGMGYSAVTNNKGIAYLFWADSDISGEAEEFAVTYSGGRQVFSETVSGSCELEFTLDSAVKPAAKSLDLMIMCDTTGSMGDELEYLKAELEDVVTRISKDNANLPIRVSVDFYRDEGDEYVVREFPFTTDLDSAVNAIAQQSAEGGGDTPEAVHTALQSAVSHDWDEDSVKVMFLVLDAPPHDDPQIIDEVVKYTREAAEKGVRIVPVAASGVDKSCEYLLRSMAMMTGGTYTFLTDDSGVGYSHMEPTIGSYDVEKLNDMMVRIVNGYLE